jgi:hypothetical protein
VERNVSESLKTLDKNNEIERGICEESVRSGEPTSEKVDGNNESRKTVDSARAAETVFPDRSNGLDGNGNKVRRRALGKRAVSKKAAESISLEERENARDKQKKDEIRSIGDAGTKAPDFQKHPVHTRAVASIKCDCARGLECSKPSERRKEDEGMSRPDAKKRSVINGEKIEGFGAAVGRNKMEAVTASVTKGNSECAVSTAE